MMRAHVERYDVLPRRELAQFGDHDLDHETAARLGPEPGHHRPREVDAVDRHAAAGPDISAVVSSVIRGRSGAQGPARWNSTRYTSVSSGAGRASGGPGAPTPPP